VHLLLSLLLPVHLLLSLLLLLLLVADRQSVLVVCHLVIYKKEDINGIKVKVQWYMEKLEKLLAKPVQLIRRAKLQKSQLHQRRRHVRFPPDLPKHRGPFPLLSPNRHLQLHQRRRSNHRRQSHLFLLAHSHNPHLPLKETYIKEIYIKKGYKKTLVLYK
jgi:hypothetical protein